MKSRFDRIQELLDELQKEIQTGMINGEIDERLEYRFVVPCSKTHKDGIVQCSFFTRPIEREYSIPKQDMYLRVVK